MSAFDIKGGLSLRGDIKIQGSKNAALPILAAAVLNRGITKIYNCPLILDIYNMIIILEAMGCGVSVDGHCVTVDATGPITGIISKENAEKMRSSVILLGAVLGRSNSAYIAWPGGCSIGERPVNMHLDALEQMNVQFSPEDGCIRCETSELIGNEIKLPYPSVGATENVILAAVLAKGTTTLYNAAKEPEIVDLCLFLNEMGAEIHGMGTTMITILGVKSLMDISYTVMNDRIVAGTYLMAAAATCGDVQIYDVQERDMKSTLEVLAHMGCGIVIRPNKIRVVAPTVILPVEGIRTEPFPGFPTDMQSQMMSVLCLASGKSVIYEEIFEDRFKIAAELEKMGADIRIEENKAIIQGKCKLQGTTIYAKDLRGGAALIIAGLMAEGDTKVKDTVYVERGYENICMDLAQLGADIKCCLNNQAWHE